MAQGDRPPPAPEPLEGGSAVRHAVQADVDAGWAALLGESGADATPLGGPLEALPQPPPAVVPAMSPVIVPAAAPVIAPAVAWETPTDPSDRPEPSRASLPEPAAGTDPAAPVAPLPSPAPSASGRFGALPTDGLFGAVAARVGGDAARAAADAASGSSPLAAEPEAAVAAPQPDEDSGREPSDELDVAPAAAGTAYAAAAAADASGTEAPSPHAAPERDLEAEADAVFAAMEAAAAAKKASRRAAVPAPVAVAASGVIEVDPAAAAGDGPADAVDGAPALGVVHRAANDRPGEPDAARRDGFEAGEGGRAPARGSVRVRVSPALQLDDARSPAPAARGGAVAWWAGLAACVLAAVWWFAPRGGVDPADGDVAAQRLAVAPGEGRAVGGSAVPGAPATLAAAQRPSVGDGGASAAATDPRVRDELDAPAEPDVPAEPDAPAEPAAPSGAAGVATAASAAGSALGPAVLEGQGDPRTVPPGTPEPHAREFAKLPVSPDDRAPVGGVGPDGLHVDRLSLGVGDDPVDCGPNRVRFSASDDKAVHVCFRVVQPRVEHRLEVAWLQDGGTVRRTWLTVPAKHAFRTRARMAMRGEYSGRWEVRISDDAGTELARLAFEIDP